MDNENNCTVCDGKPRKIIITGEGDELLAMIDGDKIVEKNGIHVIIE